MIVSVSDSTTGNTLPFLQLDMNKPEDVQHLLALTNGQILVSSKEADGGGFWQYYQSGIVISCEVSGGS